jgi:AcrR family transcriptional regulator
MRHKGINKEETRQRMVDAVGRGFQKQGYSGVGVEGLVKAAGVTSGAFYSHFGSKAGAFDVALNTGLDEVITGIPAFQKTHQSQWVHAFADYYLGAAHRKDVESGCAMAALTSEVVRFEGDISTTFETKMATIAGLIAKGLSGGSDEERTARAWSMLGILIGGVNLSRAMQNVSIAEDIAQAIKLSVVNVAGETCDFS